MLLIDGGGEGARGVDEEDSELDGKLEKDEEIAFLDVFSVSPSQPPRKREKRHRLQYIQTRELISKWAYFLHSYKRWTDLD